MVLLCCFSIKVKALSLIIGILFLVRSADGRPVNSEVTYDANDGILDGDGIKMANNNEGYTGGEGFVDFGDVGTSVSWSVDIPTTGFYDVAIRYASIADRGPLDLIVNNIKLGSFEIEKVADDWDEWDIETIKVYITATGEVQNLKLLASQIQGPNVDKIIIKPDLTICKDFNGEKNQCKENADTIFCQWKNRKNKCKVSPLCTAINGTNNRKKKKCNKNPRNCKFDVVAGCKNNDDVDVSLCPTLCPTQAPVAAPVVAPVVAPIPEQDPVLPIIVNSTVVFKSGQKYYRNQFVFSPNGGKYQVGLDSDGKLVMKEGNNNIWELEDKYGTVISDVHTVAMQPDGNLVLRPAEQGKKAIWNSETSKNYGAEFHIDDGGQLSIMFENTALWIDGLPRGIYSPVVTVSPDLEFPVRGYFYYAWYPETWTTGNEKVKYTPNLGSIGEKYYRTGDPVVVENHVKALDWGLADLSIVSWWGRSDRLDRARITQLLDETVTQRSNIKWTVYYEDEKKFDYSKDQLVDDLNYLKKWFAWHEAWAHKDGKPVIFIWNEKECEVAERWVAAAKEAGWYVVLKLFGGWKECTNQPDSWHQYGVSDSYLEYTDTSFTIGPGFFKANADEAEHPRVSRELWCEWVVKMKESKLPWQLIVSFNEWGEGTAVESAVEWKSDSGYGIYLDCLHDPVRYGPQKEL